MWWFKENDGSISLYHSPESIRYQNIIGTYRRKSWPRLRTSLAIPTFLQRLRDLLSSLVPFDFHDATKVHLCPTIRDNCQNLEYLTLSFPPPDNLNDAPH